MDANASFLVQYIHTLTGASVEVVTRTYGLKMKAGKTGHLHYRAIVHVIFGSNQAQVTELQIACGLGKKSNKYESSERVKRHYMDPHRVIALQIAKDYIGHHDFALEPHIYQPIGFTIANIPGSVLPFLAQAVQQSPIWDSLWKDHAVAVYVSPSFGFTEKAAMQHNNFTITFRCLPDYSPVVSLALDDHWRGMNPHPDQQPIYAIITTSQTNIPRSFQSEALRLTFAQSPGDKVYDVKSSDVQHAKDTYAVKQPGAQAVYIPAVVTTAGLSPWVLQQIAEQDRKEAAALSLDPYVLNESVNEQTATTTATSTTPSLSQRNTFQALTDQDDDRMDDDEGPGDDTTAAESEAAAQRITAQKEVRRLAADTERFALAAAALFSAAPKRIDAIVAAEVALVERCTKMMTKGSITEAEMASLQHAQAGLTARRNRILQQLTHQREKAAKAAADEEHRLLFIEAEVATTTNNLFDGLPVSTAEKEVTKLKRDHVAARRLYLSQLIPADDRIRYEVSIARPAHQLNYREIEQHSLDQSQQSDVNMDITQDSNTGLNRRSVPGADEMDK